MFPSARRFALIIGLLLAALVLTWGQRWGSAARFATASPEISSSPNPALQEPEYTYFVDVEGWYRITPYETVVRSPYDLTADTTEAMAKAIPSTLGEWRQLGPDEYIGDDPAVVFYLKHPTIALRRTYQDRSGQNLDLTIVGNKGEDSFLLFSHTPETCYPGRLWNVIASRRESALLDEQRMYAQYLLTEQAQSGEKLMVLFWYLWNSPERDPQDGVLSVRVNLLLSPGLSEEAALARAWGFIRLLFPRTVPWERF